MAERDPSERDPEAPQDRAPSCGAPSEQTTDRYRTLVDGAAESIVVVQDGKLVFHNPAFAEMVTVGPADFSSVPFVEFVHEDDREGLFRMYLQVLHEDAGPARHEFRTVTPAGAVRWYSIRGSVIRWQSRPALLCTLTEMTAEKRAVTALRESEEQLRQLFQSAPAGFYEIDLTHGRFLRVNDLVCEYLGYTRDELMALPPMDILGDGSSAVMGERLARYMRGEPVPETVELQVRAKDGREIWVLLNAKIMRDDDGTLRASVVAHDITARRQLDAELQNVQKLESLGVLAGGIAHDFNNLLTSILGSVSLAERTAHDAAAVARHCEAATKACTKAQRLAQQLLTFSRGGAPARAPTAVRPLIEECADIALDSSQIRYVLELPGDIWPLDADEGQIAQVISNLILNSRQAMPEGGSLRICGSNVDLPADSGLPMQSGRYVRLAVSDEGVGIDAERLPKIFDPFFSTKKAGTGLGLTAARSITERHGGHLGVESQPDVGTTFVLHLPAAPLAAPSFRTVAPLAQISPCRVLLMDDDAAVRTVGTQMLAELGCSVASACEGGEAVKRFEEAHAAGAPFVIVVMDLTVRDGMGGVEALRQLRAIDPTVLAVAASGYSTDPVLASPAQYGFDAVLHKPFSVDGLDAVLAELKSQQGEP